MISYPYKLSLPANQVHNSVTENSSSKKTTYVCKNCNSFFVSLSEVTYHKAMTGHREYEERKPNVNARLET